MSTAAKTPLEFLGEMGLIALAAMATVTLGSMQILSPRARLPRFTPRPYQYRIVERDGGFEPQMLFHWKWGDGELWYPLHETGYWADTRAFETGRVTASSVMSREGAARAIARAREDERRRET